MSFMNKTLIINFNESKIYNLIPFTHSFFSYLVIAFLIILIINSIISFTKKII